MKQDKVRAYIIMIISPISGLLLLWSFLMYVLPYTPTKFHIVGWLCLSVFEIILAICFAVAWTAIERIKKGKIKAQ